MNPAPPPSELIPSRSPAALALFRLRHHRGAIIGLSLLLLLLFITLAAPWITWADPLNVNPDLTFNPPGKAHIMGTDNIGRDVWSRFAFGGRISLQVGLIAMAISCTAGTLVGVVAGFYGGWTDSVLSWFTEVLMAFPGILLALAVIAVLGPGLINVMIAVGIGSIPSFMRLARGSVLSVKETDYILSSRALGNSDWGIMRMHILPNILRPILVLVTLGIGGAILEGAALSFLGLGAQPPTPEWGLMLSQSRGFLRQAWWMSSFPGLGIFFTILAINLLGDGLGDVLSPDYQSTQKGNL
jgi:ABC-type dipeptide/oligopeptide/nickel transport system permease subunit